MSLAYSIQKAKLRTSMMLKTLTPPVIYQIKQDTLYILHIQCFVKFINLISTNQTDQWAFTLLYEMLSFYPKIEPAIPAKENLTKFTEVATYFLLLGASSLMSSNFTSAEEKAKLKEISIAKISNALPIVSQILLPNPGKLDMQKKGMIIGVLRALSDCDFLRINEIKVKIISIIKGITFTTLEKPKASNCFIISIIESLLRNDPSSFSSNEIEIFANAAKNNIVKVKKNSNSSRLLLCSVKLIWVIISALYKTKYGKIQYQSAVLRLFEFLKSILNVESDVTFDQKLSFILTYLHFIENMESKLFASSILVTYHLYCKIANPFISKNRQLIRVVERFLIKRIVEDHLSVPATKAIELMIKSATEEQADTEVVYCKIKLLLQVLSLLPNSIYSIKAIPLILCKFNSQTKERILKIISFFPKCLANVTDKSVHQSILDYAASASIDNDDKAGFSKMLMKSIGAIYYEQKNIDVLCNTREFVSILVHKLLRECIEKTEPYEKFWRWLPFLSCMFKHNPHFKELGYTPDIENVKCFLSIWVDIFTLYHSTPTNEMLKSLKLFTLAYRTPPIVFNCGKRIGGFIVFESQVQKYINLFQNYLLTNASGIASKLKYLNNNQIIYLSTIMFLGLLKIKHFYYLGAKDKCSDITIVQFLLSYLHDSGIHYQADLVDSLTIIITEIFSKYFDTLKNLRPSKLRENVIEKDIRFLAKSVCNLYEDVQNKASEMLSYYFREFPYAIMIPNVLFTFLDIIGGLYNELYLPFDSLSHILYLSHLKEKITLPTTKTIKQVLFRKVLRFVEELFIKGSIFNEEKVADTIKCYMHATHKSAETGDVLEHAGIAFILNLYSNFKSVTLATKKPMCLLPLIDPELFDSAIKSYISESRISH